MTDHESDGSDILTNYAGVDIVRYPEAGREAPCIEGTEIPVHSIGEYLDDHEDEATARNAFRANHDELSDDEAQAAVDYYTDHPREMERFHKRDEVWMKIDEVKTYVCECGAEFIGAPSLLMHVAKAETPRDHQMADSHYENHEFVCDCGSVFSSPDAFRDHLDIPAGHSLAECRQIDDPATPD